MWVVTYHWRRDPDLTETYGPFGRQSWAQSWIHEHPRSGDWRSTITRLIEVEAKVRVPYIPSELLRAALKPFADAVTDLPAYYNDEQRYISAVAGVNLEDFETAFRVLKRLQKKVRP